LKGVILPVLHPETFRLGADGKTVSMDDEG